MFFLKDIQLIVAAIKDEIISVNREIWGFAELSFHEYNSSAFLKKLLLKHGFSIEENAAGIPTAFVAKWGSGNITAGILCEYDALSGMCQEKSALERQLPAGKTESDPGHGCGHNVFAAGTVGAAIALKEYCLQHNRNELSIYLFGCPAEEDGSGKSLMARAGYFHDMDFCITWHPDIRNTVVGISSLACLSAKFSFSGVQSHAAATPHLGKSALDACELMNVGTNYLREHISPFVRMHYSFLDAGSKAPNVVPDRASTLYYIRAPKIAEAYAVLERVKKIAQGAALMADVKAEIIQLDGLCDFLPSKALGELCAEVMKAAGAPPYDENDVCLAKAYAETYDQSELTLEKQRLCAEHNLPRGRLDGTFFDNLIGDYKHQPEVCEMSSTDVGDVSYCCPTVQLYIAAYPIATPFHSWQMTALSESTIAHKAALHAATVLAGCVLHIAEHPKALEAAAEQYKQQVPQGYICPCPESYDPFAKNDL